METLGDTTPLLFSSRPVHVADVVVFAVVVVVVEVSYLFLTVLLSILRKEKGCIGHKICHQLRNIFLDALKI